MMSMMLHIDRLWNPLATVRFRFGPDDLLD